MAQALKYFPLFSDASDEEVESVSKLFEPRELKPGDKLYTEGDKADKMFFLYLGKVVLTSTDDIGLVMELTRLDEMGALVGDEMLFSDKKVRNCSVTALEHCVLFSVAKRGFDKFSNILPPLAKSIESK